MREGPMVNAYKLRLRRFWTVRGWYGTDEKQLSVERSFVVLRARPAESDLKRREMGRRWRSGTSCMADFLVKCQNIIRAGPQTIASMHPHSDG